MIPVTLAIIACNEEDRLGRAIESVAGVKEVLVLDSGSSDATVCVAESLGARVIRTDWPGYGAQKNRALAEATQPWVFFLDADEWADPNLVDSLATLAYSDPEMSGFAVKRRNHWLGRPLRGGCMGPSWKVRLARANRCQWEGGILHETLKVHGRVGRLKGVLEHDPYRTAQEQQDTALDYAGLFVRKALSEGRRARFWEPGVRAILHFVKSILLRAGCLDGVLGWRMAWIGAAEVALKWSLLRSSQAVAEQGSETLGGRHAPCNESEAGGATL
ncbi:MAG: glycosyltransferase family 2 protein [Myxococcota bacterium]|nr:glycosyltransferase family 2 protein [Myxococcota bacterium]